MTFDAATVADQLDRTRSRTLGLTDDLDETELRRQQSPLMSPLVWDLAHIGNYEELWLLRSIDNRPAIDEKLDWLYNAFEHPRWTRPDLPILSPTESRSYLADVRAEVVDLLGKVELNSHERLLQDGFVYGMVLQHEHQHCETMLATRQLMEERAPAVPLLPRVPTDADPSVDCRPLVDGMIAVDGGTFVIGTSTNPWAYDNERPAHDVTLSPFLIDRAPVTVTEYLAFVEAGGYRDERLWHPEGWRFIRAEGLEHPQYWHREGSGSWSLVRFGRVSDLHAHGDEPVQHVCWYEADAFARWSDKRLPSEAEWERAASGSDEHRPAANLGQSTDGPAPVTTQPVAPSGAVGMLGGVWEWTSSDFSAYPGFESFPYDEYSKVFFGPEYKVLRGGSWAADPLAVRSTFRNWDYPIRRQVFAGFRCAKDA